MGQNRKSKRRHIQNGRSCIAVAFCLLVPVFAPAQEKAAKATETTKGTSFLYRCSDESLMREIEMRNYELGDGKVYSDQVLIYYGPDLIEGEIKFREKKYRHKAVVSRRYWKTASQLVLAGYQKKTTNGIVAPSTHEVSQLVSVTGAFDKLEIKPGQKATDIFKWQRIRDGKKSEASYKIKAEIAGTVPFQKNFFPEVHKYAKLPSTGLRINLEFQNVKDPLDVSTFTGVWSQSLKTYLSYVNSGTGFVEACSLYYTEKI